MRVGGIATLNLSLLLRQSIAAGQRDLAAAQTELATGRRADVGLFLGAGAARSLDWRAELAGLDALADRNGMAAVRSDVYQATLAAVGEVAADFVSALAGSRSAPNGQELARTAAIAARQQLTALLNVSHDGQHLFAGLDAADPPLRDYAGSPAAAAVDAAFLQTFGFGQDDPLSEGIDAAAMAAFLDGAFADIFSSTGWTANWSSASDQTPLARIDRNMQVRASVSANIAPVRQLMEAVTMVADLGTPVLNQGAFETVVDRSLAFAGTAGVGVGEEQARLGIVESQIETARQRIDSRAATLATTISAAEGVDEYEAAARVNLLMIQLEASYTLTGKISQLSLMNFI